GWYLTPSFPKIPPRIRTAPRECKSDALCDTALVRTMRAAALSQLFGCAVADPGCARMPEHAPSLRPKRCRKPLQNRPSSITRRHLRAGPGRHPVETRRRERRSSRPPPVLREFARRFARTGQSLRDGFRPDHYGRSEPPTRPARTTAPTKALP